MAALKKIISITSRPNLLTLVGAPRSKAFEVLKVKYLPKYPSILPGNSHVSRLKLLSKHLVATQYRVNVDELTTPAMYQRFPLKVALSPPKGINSIHCMYECA
mmetsp:Transcript_1008/g.1279  ORF Transcript_1008/g.1279 Transcript_1008/m.1279 type:complete len:103 (-) Transcript_1008:261-569(-)